MWQLREPVRLYLYGIAGVGVAALVVYGVLTDAQASLWVTVAATLLAVPVGTEVARSKVTPVATAPPPLPLPGGEHDG
jgi:hypothetical protein